MSDPLHEIVASGYDVVYEAQPRSPTLLRIWREHAMGRDFPEGFEHISFLTLDDMARMARELRLRPGAHLVDLACGAGGPGLWIARETGARLTGIDLSPIAIAQAAKKAGSLGVAATYAVASFDATMLPDASADGAMSVDAFQYAPDKAASFREFARIIRSGGRLVIIAFELDPHRVAPMGILNTDPVSDYRPALDAAGFDVGVYDQTEGWRARVESAYGAVIAAREAIAAEMGEGATNALLSEMTATLDHDPYCGRPFFAATRR